MDQSPKPPMQQALSTPKESSADIKTWYREFVRERALHDECTLIQAAERRGELRGLEKSRQARLQESSLEGLHFDLSKMMESGIPEERARSIYPPVQQALNLLKDLSSDAEAQHRAMVRERALMQAAEQKGRLEGKLEGKQEALTQMIASGIPEAQARAILGL